MGNQLAPPAKLQSDHIAELPNVVFKDTLGARPQAQDRADGRPMGSRRWTPRCKRRQRQQMRSSLESGSRPQAEGGSSRRCFACTTMEARSLSRWARSAGLQPSSHGHPAQLTGRCHRSPSALGQPPRRRLRRLQQERQQAASHLQPPAAACAGLLQAGRHALARAVQAAAAGHQVRPRQQPPQPPAACKPWKQQAAPRRLPGPPDPATTPVPACAPYAYPAHCAATALHTPPPAGIRPHPGLPGPQPPAAAPALPPSRSSHLPSTPHTTPSTPHPPATHPTSHPACRRSRLSGIDCPHVWPIQSCVETPSAGYMMRQHFFANLYDRLSTRPFLSDIEKVRRGGGVAELRGWLGHRGRCLPACVCVGGGSISGGASMRS
jgi:hypothetical protein